MGYVLRYHFNVLLYLCNGKCFIQIAKSVQFPFFTFNGNIELTDTLQCQFFFLYQNSYWFPHEPSCNL